MVEDYKWKVTTWDVHSGVAATCFEDHGIEFQNVQVDFFINRFANKGLFDGTLENLVVVAPDKGAVARANLAAKTLGVTDVVYGEKVRDPENGEILGLLLKRELPDGTVSSDIKDLAVEGKRVLIVDDICDGGRTFIELAKSLKSYHVSTIDLYVTHGIFSKGFSVFEDNLGQSLINRFFVPNVFPGVTPPPEDFAKLYTLP
jgi:ribose-phosphate pyrophosphokinase